jgi:hypothetical protein
VAQQVNAIQGLPFCGFRNYIDIDTGFLLSVFFDLKDGGDMFPPKRLLTFNGLREVLSQKTELFITTAVRTSDLTFVYRLLLELLGRGLSPS